MSKKCSKTILKEAISNYNLFRPDNQSIEVWVHSLKDAVDEELYDDQEQMFIFEINTDKMIHRTYEALLSQQFDNYLQISYTFTPIQDKEYTHSRNLGLFTEVNNDYFRCILKTINDISPEDRYIEGNITVSIPCKFSEKTDDILKCTYRAALVFVSYKANSQAAAQSYTNLKASRDIAISLLQNNHNQITQLVPSGKTRLNTLVRIYNVGCANTVFIQHYTGLNILFDCGIENSTLYDNSKAKIQALDPDVIILSHWHSDHYNLINNYLRNNHLQYIIYNDICKCSDNQLLFTLASIKEKTIDLSITYSSYMFNTWNCDDISLFIGSGLKPTNTNYGYISYHNEINDTGIILCVGTADNYHDRVILPGDVSYYCWPSEKELDLNTVSYLLVPHHGGSVYISDLFKNPNYPRIYVSRNSSYVPISNINNTKAHTYHKTFLEDSLGTYQFSYLKYTSKISSTSCPYYKIRIMRK